MRTPSQVETDMLLSGAAAHNALQMSDDEFRVLTAFKVSVDDALQSGRALAIIRPERYAQMTQYIERLAHDIGMHHEAFAPFFPIDTGKDN